MDNRGDSGDPDELELTQNADTIIDGRFVESLRTLETPFVGSSNQRVIKISAAVVS
ncbi:MAG: radical SAM protein [Synergistaceae bacterium]|nr:radical SAM protein [Synergistaceae bacterium]